MSTGYFYFLQYCEVWVCIVIQLACKFKIKQLNLKNIIFRLPE